MDIRFFKEVEYGPGKDNSKHQDKKSVMTSSCLRFVGFSMEQDWMPRLKVFCKTIYVNPPAELKIQ